MGLGLVRSQYVWVPAGGSIFWLAFAVAGLALLLPTTRSAGTLDRTVGYLPAAGACWALYIVFGQKASAVGTAASTWGVLIAACEIVPIGAASAGTALLSPTVLPLGLAIAIMSALPYTLESIAPCAGSR